MATSVPDLITQEAQAQGVDPDFALAIAHQESGFNQGARSPKGAMGVMQLMPATAKDLGVDPSNVKDNIKGGVKYLAQLGSRYNGDPALVAAAYNAGPGAVDRFGGVPPYAETQNYVNRVTGIHKVFSGTNSSDGGSPTPTAEDLAAMDRIINGDSSTDNNIAAMTAAVLKGSPAETPGPVAASPKPMAEPPTIAEIEAQSKAQGYKDPPPINVPAASESPLQQAADKTAQDARNQGGIMGGFANAFHAVPFGDIVQPELTAGIAAGQSALDNITHGRPLIGASGTPDNPVDVFLATRKANANANAKFYSEHPGLGLVAAGGQIAGGLGAGGALAPVAKGISGALGGGTLADIAGSVGSGALAAGGASGYAANQRGESLGDQARDASLGALIGGGAGAAAEAAAPVLSKVPTTLGRVAAGSLIGGAFGAATGHPAEGILAGAGIGLGADGMTLPGGKARQADAAYSDLRPADIEALQSAPQGATAGEVLGPTRAAKYVEAGASESPATAQKVVSGMAAADRNAADVTADRIASLGVDDPALAGKTADLEQRGFAVGPKGSQTLAEQTAAAQESMPTLARVNREMEAATGIDPATASQEMAARVKAGQAQVAPKYEALADDSPVTSPDLESLQKYPIVRQAIQKAKDVLGPEAVTTVTETTPGAPPYESGTPLTPDQRQAMAVGDTSWMAGSPPKTTTREVLTARGWQKAEQIFNAGPRDANGAPVKDNSVKGEYVELAKRLSPALDEAIPGRQAVNQEAKEAYLRPRSNFQKGEALWASGKTAEPIESLEARAAKMSPQERRDTGAGYLAGQNRALIERGPSALREMGETEFHSRVRKALFGNGADRAMQQTLRREAAFQRAKPPKGEDETYAEAREAGYKALDRGKASESGEELDARLAQSSAQERRANRLGLLQRVYEGLKDGSLDAREVASNPKMQHVLESVFGKKKAKAITAELTAHAERQDAREAIKRTLGKEPQEDHSLTEGVVIHGAEHGALHGTLHGLVAGATAKLGRYAAKKGFTTPAGRSAMARAMAEPADQVAAKASAVSAKRAVQKARMSGVVRGGQAGLASVLPPLIGSLGATGQ